MCIICDGETFEDGFLAFNKNIGRNGWAMQAVEPGLQPGWLYTIGLAENYLHRELLVVGCDIELARDLLDELAARVRDGERFAADTFVETEYGDYELVAVHANQLRTSVIAMWHAYYEYFGRQPMRPRPLQLVVPEAVCGRHGAGEWRLDRASPLFTEGGRPPRRHSRDRSVKRPPRSP